MQPFLVMGKCPNHWYFHCISFLPLLERKDWPHLPFEKKGPEHLTPRESSDYEPQADRLIFWQQSVRHLIPNKDVNKINFKPYLSLLHVLLVSIGKSPLSMLVHKSFLTCLAEHSWYLSPPCETSPPCCYTTCYLLWYVYTLSLICTVLFQKCEIRQTTCSDFLFPVFYWSLSFLLAINIIFYN